jgi:hypothetical protein
MVFGKYEKFQLAVVTVCAVILGWDIGQTLLMAQNAVAAELSSPNSTGISLPDWIWTAIVTGVVAGATTYGMVKVKLDWIFERLVTLETTQRTDTKELHGRINGLLLSNQRRRAGDAEETH